MVLLLLAALVGWWASAEAADRAACYTTLLFAGLVAILTSAVSILMLPLHLWAHRPARNAAWLVWFLLLFVPVYVQAAAWQAGAAWWGWQALGVASSHDPWLWRWGAALWIHVMAAMPWAMWILRCGINQIDRTVLESAVLEASRGRVFRHVISVELLPWVALATSWAAIVAATELFVVDLYLIPAVARQLYTGFAIGTDALSGVKMAAGTVLAGGLLVSLIWQPERWRSARWDAVFAEPIITGQPALWWASALLVLIVIGVLLVPVGSLWIEAGTLYDASGARHWSWQRFLEKWSSGWSDFRQEIYGTLVVSAAAAVLGVSSSFALLAVVFGKRPEACGWCWAVVLALLPGPLVGIGLTAALRLPGWHALVWLFDQTLFAPIVAAALRGWPLCWIVLVLAWRNVPRSYWETAFLEAVPRRRFIGKVVWPMTRAPAAVALVLALAHASGELAATLIVIPPGAETVAVRIANLMHTGVRDKEAVLCLYHLLGCCGIVLVTWVGLIHTGWHGKDRAGHPEHPTG